MTPDRFIAAAFMEELLALAQEWQDEASSSWGESWEASALQRCCDELRAKLSAALAWERVGYGWQPIETAPRDGSVVLLVTDYGVVASAWDESTGYFGNDYVEYDCATHWMPMPQPPSNITAWNTRYDDNGMVGGWLPIESAPMDGTEFLGYRQGTYANAYRVQRDDCEMWVFGGVWGAIQYAPHAKPTHWMLLPPPPTTAASQGGES